MLIRSNIDYSKIDLGTVKGVVYFRGIFRPILPPQMRNEEMVKIYIEKSLIVLEKKVRSIPGVSDVIFQFTNWEKDKGRWFPIQSMKKGLRKEGEGPREKRKEGEEKGELQVGAEVSENFE